MAKLFKVEIITRSEKLSALKSALAQHNVKGMTISNVMGAGNQKGKTEIYRGSETTIDLLPKIRIEILTEASMVDSIVEKKKKELNTGNAGDGKIILIPIDNVIRIRTGQEGEDAL